MMSIMCFYSSPPTPQNVHLLVLHSGVENTWEKKKEVCLAHKHTDCFYLVTILKSTQCPNHPHSIFTVLGTADLTDTS